MDTHLKATKKTIELTKAALTWLKTKLHKDSTPVLNPEPEFTPEIAQRSAAKTPHHPLDGYTTEHGLNYDDLGEENQDPENWAE